MRVSLQEGKDLLGDKELEKTRAQTEAVKEATAEQSSPQKPSIPRDNTMVVTAQVSSVICLLLSFSLPIPLSLPLSLSFPFSLSLSLSLSLALSLSLSVVPYVYLIWVGILSY